MDPEPIPVTKLLLTVEDAAQVLSIGRTAVYELMGSGQLPWVSIGRSRRIKAAALAAYVDQLPSSCPRRHNPGAQWTSGDRALRPGPTDPQRASAEPGTP